MKKNLCLLLAIALLQGCNQKQPIAEEGTIEQAANTSTTYGAAFEEENVIPASELVKAVADKDSLQATVAAEIKESCQAKGCWMDVKLADSSNMKVTFRDYGFFVPLENLEGRQVVFTGTAKREVISVEDQRHYAKDAGKSEAEIAAITAPKEELRFIADGIILK
ncbi:DUF4920 domain-containing protein [Pontibacter korlensis]|uniref:DUF4920 domain-containing protein n=1 Tax=Pontibacter korlensis TaxID=400092 RepID=A0A0E3UXU9_9BACT|nr:DUF4920 domain-containing protein [Pontibacter korlensis]AKD04557.1 hypothetical protein PKOR_17470 [Pontibacter korlensis]